jgi:hypothetical protein
LKRRRRGRKKEVGRRRRRRWQTSKKLPPLKHPWFKNWREERRRRRRERGGGGGRERGGECDGIGSFLHLALRSPFHLSRSNSGSLVNQRRKESKENSQNIQMCPKYHPKWPFLKFQSQFEVIQIQKCIWRNKKQPGYLCSSLRENQKKKKGKKMMKNLFSKRQHHKRWEREKRGNSEKKIGEGEKWRVSEREQERARRVRKRERESRRGRKEKESKRESKGEKEDKQEWEEVHESAKGERGEAIYRCWEKSMTNGPNHTSFSSLSLSPPSLALSLLSLLFQRVFLLWKILQEALKALLALKEGRQRQKQGKITKKNIFC